MLAKHADTHLLPAPNALNLEKMMLWTIFNIVMFICGTILFGATVYLSHVIGLPSEAVISNVQMPCIYTLMLIASTGTMFQSVFSLQRV